ncbi:MAG: hypothetical protein ACM32J_03190 [Rhizobacter sp.]|jgi:hypothetical protein
MLTQELLDTIERDAPATPARGLRLHRAMLKAELARPHTPALRAATTALLLKLEHLERCESVASDVPSGYLAPHLIVLPQLSVAA